MKLFLLSLIAVALTAQTATLNWQVQMDGTNTVQAKYGSKLPKNIRAGSVTVHNTSNVTAVFSQPVALQILRAKGYPVLSREDAIAVLTRAQGRGASGAWNRWAPFAIKIMDDLKDLQVLHVLPFGVTADVVLVTVDEVAKRTLPDITAALQQTYQTYTKDGIQDLMQLPPGGGLTGTLFFETSPKLKADAAETFTVSLPMPATPQPRFTESPPNVPR